MAEAEHLQALQRELGNRLAVFRNGAGMTQAQLGQALYCDRTMITRLEAGSRSKDEGFWTKADALLDARGALVAAFRRLDAAKREQRQATREAAVLAYRMPLDSFRDGGVSVPRPGELLELGTPPTQYLAQIKVESPSPANVGWSDVEQVRTMTKWFAESENLFGGGLSCEAGAGQLRWAARLIEARATSDVHRALHEAVGNLAGVVAFSAFDIDDQDAARKYFEFARWCAEQGGSWSLRATTLADMARQASYAGDHEEALSLIDAAGENAGRLSATGRAMVTTMRARYLALAGRHDEARSAVARADDFFAERQPAEDPPWLVYYDEAEHQGSTARALTPAALVARAPASAARRLQAAIRLHSDDYPRSRAFSRVRLATLVMAAGDPRQAVTIGQKAVEEAAGLHSRRMIDELQGLHLVAARHTVIPEVAGLRAHLAPIVGTKRQRPA